MSGVEEGLTMTISVMRSVIVDTAAGKQLNLYLL